jgi:hypothetical protein
VLLYRQALEIHLKILVGEGSGFLPVDTDPILLSASNPLHALAKIVCQIIQEVGWQSEFKSLGVGNLDEFGAFVNEVESFDPVSRAIRNSRTKGPDSVSEFYRDFDIFRFATRLNALLELLDSTADALAAEFDRLTDLGDADFSPTVQ